MKNTVNVVLFLLALFFVGFLFRDYLQVGVLQYFSMLLTLSVIFISFVIFLENRHPSQTITWLVVLGSFPLFGFFFYLLFGRNYRKERMFRKKFFLDKQTLMEMEGSREKSLQHLSDIGEDYPRLFQLAHKVGNTPISFSTETRVLTNGHVTFSTIKKALLDAKEHIHIEYYILRNDQLGNEIKDILIQKVREGVKIRLLYDAVGSWTLSKKYIDQLKAEGIEAVAFGPVKIPFLNNKFNFRNHRKIIVIDGSVGFVGGLNIGNEYLGKDANFGFWRDTHLILKGDAVRSLQLIFLQDWYYMTNHSFLTDEYLTPVEVAKNNHGGVQIVAGGPDREFSVIKDIFFSMITSAKKSVWIASPYFIPDEDIFSALKVAALSGIDVRLLVPKNPDKKLVYYASRSYFPDLLEAGVNIHEYHTGFMHAKLIIVDGELASIGTSNMDMRSFHLNFEVNAFLYKTNSVQTLVGDFVDDMQVSNQLSFDAFHSRRFGLKIFESLARLLSPLL